MSFGFGFALPAYPLRGGGGNNPFNQLGPTLDLSFVDGATNVGDQLGPDTYTLNTDFITPEYQVAAQYAIWENGVGLAQKTFSQIVTFTRASTATYFNSTGTLTTAAINEARFDYNPSTLAPLGFLIEEARTNSIRNNTMVGAVAGTPGTLPQVSGVPSWNVSGLGTLTREVIGTGTTANGIAYIDLRFSGTTSTSQLSIRLEPGGTGAISAANGQTWSMSLWSAIVAGSLTNITGGQGYGTLLYDAAGAFIGAPFSSGVLNTTSTLVRTQTSGTIATAGAAFIQPQIFLGFAPGVAIDITLRIGLPQLEQGAFATSVIPTTTTALTRSADVASVNTLSPWYNTSGGTIYAEATGPIASIYRILAEGATASDFRDFSLAFDGLRGNFAARYVAGNFDVLGPTNSLTAGATVKLAGSYSATSADMAYNGVLAVSKNAITQRIPADRMFLGSRLGSSLQLNGHLRRVTYYPRTLSTAELQSITT